MSYTCEHCQQEFESKHARRFCCRKCYWAHPRAKEHVAKLVANLVKANAGSSGMKGRHHSDETKKLISEQTKRGMTEEICEKISERQTGENNKRWIKDRSQLKNVRNGVDANLFMKWRIDVYKRDDYTCQFCGKRGGKLNADHIKPVFLFPELALELSNGRTLCYECHKKTDTFCGKVRKLTKEDFV